MTYTGRLGSAASQPGRIKLGALDEPGGGAVNISAVAAVLTLTVPAPTVSGASSMPIVAVAAVLTLTAPAPAMAVAIVAPAAVLTLRMRVPRRQPVAPPATPGLPGWEGGALRITIAGIDCTGLTVKGLSITESLGSPSSCSFEVADLDKVWPQWLDLPSLCEVSVGPLPGHSDYLFRGQLTTDKRTAASVRPGIRHTITATGYQRLLPKSLVGPLTDAPRSIVSDNESSLVNENPYDTSVEGAGLTDGGVIADLLTRYWEGPPLDLSGIGDYKKPTPRHPQTFDPPLRWSNVGIDSAIPDIQSRTDPITTTFWMDEDGFVRYTELVSGYETAPDYGYPAPYKLAMADDPDDPTIIMPMSIEDSLEYGNIIRQLQVAGTTPWAVRTYDLGVGYLPYGGIESTSSGAISAEDARMDAWWGVVNRLAVRINGTARISPGHDGWHPGQIVSITDDQLYVDVGGNPMTYYFVIRAVTVDVISGTGPAPTIEYTLSYGDVEPRSFARESKGINWSYGTDEARALHVNVETFDPAPPVGGLQLMRAYIVNAYGAPMPQPKRTVRWSLWVGGVGRAAENIGIGTEAVGWWFVGTWDGNPAEPGNTGINPDTNYAYIQLNRGVNSVEGDYADVTAELLDEPA